MSERDGNGRHGNWRDGDWAGVPLAEQSAEAIAQRAQRGGPRSAALFEELVRRYEGRLFNFLVRRAGREGAEDLTQETFVRAWERLESYDAAWRFSTWLFTIGARLAITRHRRARATLGPAALEGAAAPRVGNEREVEQGARLWALADQHLSEDQQTALWLRYAEDMAIGDIARVMEKSEVGVRVCLFRARHALAELAGLEGVTDAASGAGDRGQVVVARAAGGTPGAGGGARAMGSLAGGA